MSIDFVNLITRLGPCSNILRMSGCRWEGYILLKKLCKKTNKFISENKDVMKSWKPYYKDHKECSEWRFSNIYLLKEI